MRNAGAHAEDETMNELFNHMDVDQVKHRSLNLFIERKDYLG